MFTAAYGWQISGSGPADYERYTVSRMFRPLAQMLLQELRPRPGMRVLDVACGTGVVARLAAPLVLPGGSVVGIDVNEEMLRVARALSPEMPLIEYERCDAQELPFADAGFDIVLCQQGLQFFSDRLRALREMHRVVREGGSVGVAVFAQPDEFIRALSQELGRYIDATTRNQTLAPFALAEVHALRQLAHQAGLKDLGLRSVWLERRIVPTQEWLLEFSAGLPYGRAIAAMGSIERAAMIRDLAAQLKDFWKEDHFALRAEVHLMRGRR